MPPNVIARNYNWKGMPAWREFIGYSPGCTSTSSFAFGGGTQSALNIDINFADTGLAIPALLGTAYCDNQVSPNTPSRLRRTLPAQHPEFTHLFGTRVASVMGIGFAGGIAPSAGLGGGAYSVYRFRRLTVVFESPPYPILADWQIDQNFGGGGPLGSASELYRFVWPEFEFTSEALIREDLGPGQATGWKYAEGTNASGKSVPSIQTQYLSRIALTLNWEMLPELGLFDGTSTIGQAGFPNRIKACVNKVNSQPFWGAPAGTLLCDPPQLTPVATPHFFSMSPFPAAGRYWHAKLKFRFFDPPLAAGATTRGWNTAPYPADDNGWALIKSGGTSPRTLYDTIDFNQMLSAMNPIN